MTSTATPSALPKIFAQENADDNLDSAMALCGDIDSCPLDPNNDEDSDNHLCGNVDTCEKDQDNDRDSDWLCAHVAPLPLRR